jgi:predicted flap endonuclease-1-like 5' DNA nuclease
MRCSCAVGEPLLVHPRRCARGQAAAPVSGQIEGILAGGQAAEDVAGIADSLWPTVRVVAVKTERRHSDVAISISKLKGLSQDAESRLRTHGIANSDQLLEAARTPAGRQALAQQIGVEPRAVLELANRADLARIRGVAGIFGDLLEHAGVDTVKELATRNAANLHRALVETNAREHLAGRQPNAETVAGWVAQAKELPPIIEY